MNDRPRGTSLFTAALLIACLGSSSCFTTHLWGGSVDDDDRDGSFELDLNGGESPDAPWWQLVLATPLALVLDLCTLPVQAFLYGWDEDDDDDW